MDNNIYNSSHLRSFCTELGHVGSFNKVPTVQFSILLIYVYFGYLFDKQLNYAVLILLIIWMAYDHMVHGRIFVSTKHVVNFTLTIAFVAFMSISILMSTDPLVSLKVSVVRTVYLSIGLFLTFEPSWSYIAPSIFLGFSLVHVVATNISYLFPKLFQEMILVLLPLNVQDQIRYFHVRSFHSGITNQIGRNSYYLSLGFIALMCGLLTYRKFRWKLFILLLTVITAILLTGKIGPVIALLITSQIVLYLRDNARGKSLTRTSLSFVFITVIILGLIMAVLPGALAPVVRLMTRMDTDVTSGRLYLFDKAFSGFIDRPIFGLGTGSFSVRFETGTHNMYLQILYENGLVGLTLILAIFTYNLINGLRRLRKVRIQQKQLYLVLFSVFMQLFFLIYGLFENAINDGFVLLSYLAASAISYQEEFDLDDFEDIFRFGNQAILF